MLSLSLWLKAPVLFSGALCGMELFGEEVGFGLCGSNCTDMAYWATWPCNHSDGSMFLCFLPLVIFGKSHGWTRLLNECYGFLGEQSKAKDMELKGHTDSVDQLCWDPKHADLLATASGDKTVRLWDARSEYLSMYFLALPTLLIASWSTTHTFL